MVARQQSMRMLMGKVFCMSVDCAGQILRTTNAITQLFNALVLSTICEEICVFGENPYAIILILQYSGFLFLEEKLSSFFSRLSVTSQEFQLLFILSIVTRLYYVKCSSLTPNGE